MKFNKCLSKIYQHNFPSFESTSDCLSQIYQHNFSDQYTIESTSLSQIYQHNFPTYIRLNQQISHKYISTILTSNCLSQIYQHNFSDLYTIKSTSNYISKVFP